MLPEPACPGSLPLTGAGSASTKVVPTDDPAEEEPSDPAAEVSAAVVSAAEASAADVSAA